VEDGSLYMCGSFRDANGSIGLTEAGPQKTPVLIPCDRSIIKIASGGDHILALTVDGQVYSAGKCQYPRDIHTLYHPMVGF